MIIVEKRGKKRQIFDFAVPYDRRADEIENEKILKYQSLAGEVKRLWDTM